MVWVVWLWRAMGRHDRFKNLRIGPWLSNRIGTADSNLEASQVPSALSMAAIMSKIAAAVYHRRRCRLVGHSCGSFARLWPRAVASYRRTGHPGRGTVIWNSPQRAARPTVTVADCRGSPATWSSRLGSLSHQTCTAGQHMQNKHVDSN